MYLPVIKSAAHRWGDHWHIDRDDAFQQATLGFLRACDLYDTASSPLSNYVHLWARAKIGSALGNGVTTRRSRGGLQRHR